MCKRAVCVGALGLAVCIWAITPVIAGERVGPPTPDMAAEIVPGLSRAPEPAPVDGGLVGGPRAYDCPSCPCAGLLCQNTVGGVPNCSPGIGEIQGGVRCAAGITNADNAWARQWDLVTAFEIKCVTFALNTCNIDDLGNEALVPSSDIVVNVYEDPTPGTPASLADAILLGSGFVTVPSTAPDDSLWSVDFGACGVFLAAGKRVVVEYVIEDLTANGQIGEYNMGHTDGDTGHVADPLYLRSDGCGMTDWVRTDDIGFPDEWNLIAVEGTPNGVDPDGTCCYDDGVGNWTCTTPTTFSGCQTLAAGNGFEWTCPPVACASLVPICGEGACCYEGGNPPGSAAACIEESKALCNARFDFISWTVNQSCAETTGPAGTCFVAPLNDDCDGVPAGGFTLLPGDGTFASTNLGATRDGPLDTTALGACGTTPIETDRDVWFGYVVPCNDGFGGSPTVIVSTVSPNTTYDTLIEVFSDDVADSTCSGPAECPFPAGNNFNGSLACNDDINAGGIPGEWVDRTHSLAVAQTTTPSSCLIIRVSSLTVQNGTPGNWGPFELIVDCVPFNGGPDTFGRCCYTDATPCADLLKADCTTSGGFFRWDHEASGTFGGVANTPIQHSCRINPCPAVGLKCYNAQALADNTTIITTTNRVRYYRYTTAAPATIFDTCGSTFDSVIRVYAVNPGSTPGTVNGECNTLDLLAENDDCIKGVAGSEEQASCFVRPPAIERTSCVCLGDGGLTEVIIEVGQFDATDGLVNPDLGSMLVLNITKVLNCTTCVKTCTGNEEVNENETACYPNPLPVNDGCSVAPPGPYSFTPLNWGGSPITMCGSAEVYDLNQNPVSPNWTRDEDWYSISVPTASELNWSVNAEFPVEIFVYHADPDPLVCATVVSSLVTDLSCDTLELRTQVCPNTYYVVVRPRLDADPLTQQALLCGSVYNAVLEIKPVPPPNCCKADLDNNGVLDGRDIQHFVEMLTKPLSKEQGCLQLNFCQADMNDDLVLDMNDVPLFITALFSKVDCVSTKPTCEDKAKCQFPGVGFDNTTRMVSDLNLDIDNRVADGFWPTQSSDITEVCWWGSYLEWLPGLGAACGSVGVLPGTGDDFTVSYYLDDNGTGRCPGTWIASFSQSGGTLTMTDPGTAAGTVPGGSADTMYSYSATHTAVAVTAGQCYWIEIVDNTAAGGNPSCVWLWQASSQGDTRSAAHTQAAPGVPGALPTNYVCPDDQNSFDLAFCVNVLVDKKEACGIPVGRCCFPLAGGPPAFSCQDNMLEADCTAQGGSLWLEGETCASAPCPLFNQVWDNFPNGYGGNCGSSMRDEVGTILRSQVSDDFELLTQNPGATSVTIHQYEFVSSCRGGGPPCNDDAYNVYFYDTVGVVPEGSASADPAAFSNNSTHALRSDLLLGIGGSIVDNGNGTETITIDLTTPYVIATPATKFWVAGQIENDIDASLIEGCVRSGPNNTGTGVPTFLLGAVRGCPNGCEGGAPIAHWTDWLDTNGDPTDLAFRLHGIVTP